MFRSDEARKIKINFNPFAKGFTSTELTDTFYKLTCEPRQAILLLESIGFDDVDAEYNQGEVTCAGCIGSCDSCGNQGRDNGMVMEAVRVKAYSRTAQTMAALARSLNKYMKDKGLTVGEAVIGKPKKSGLFATVTVQFPVSDGQTISIVFHSPDNNKNVIGAADEILAFRWLLNKRDITVAVSPEGEADVSLEEVGKRVAMLVEKNTVRFTATQKDLVDAKKSLDDLKAGVGTEQANNATVLAQLHDMQVNGEALDNQIAMSTDQLAKVQDFNAGLQSQIDSLAAQVAANAGKAKGEGEKTPEQVKAEADAAEFEMKTASFEQELVGRGFKPSATPPFYQYGEYVLSENYRPLTAGVITYGSGDKAGFGVEVQSAGTTKTMPKLFTSATLAGFDTQAVAALAWIDKKLGEMKKQIVPDVGPTTPEGYATISGNAELEAKYQDSLDAMFQSRIVEVRNALRGLGWQGERGQILTKGEDKVYSTYKNAGAGGNLVGVTWAVNDGDNGYFADDLTKSTEELATAINAASFVAQPAVTVNLEDNGNVVSPAVQILNDILAGVYDADSGTIGDRLDEAAAALESDGLIDDPTMDKLLNDCADHLTEIMAKEAA